MKRVRLLAAMVMASWSVGALGQAPATGVTVFEGARMIVGDTRAPIENASHPVVKRRRLREGIGRVHLDNLEKKRILLI